MNRLLSACSIALSLVGCSLDSVPITDATTETESASGSDSGSDGPAPDLPVEPDCPASLGEAVACECAVVEGCAIANAEPSTGCAFECEDIPSPCPAVTCTFDGSTSWPTCEADLDVAALQCVFDALAEGQPFRWSTSQSDTYVNSWHDSIRRFLRLEGTTYVLYGEERMGNHSEFDTYNEHRFVGVEIPESAWLECDAAPSDYDRFNCLHALESAGEPCADPSALICP